MGDAFYILAVDFDDAIKAIVMVVFMLLMALGKLLKKKPPRQDKGEVIIFPTQEPHEYEQPQAPRARPSGPARSSGERPQPRPTARPQPPQVRPSPVGRQQPPQVRPTPIQRPTARAGEPTRPTAIPGEPARPGPVPRRPDRVARPRPTAQRVQQPQPTVKRPRQAHRVRAAEHAEQVAAHAEHVASQLRELQMQKAGDLELGEHFHEVQPEEPRRVRHPLLGRLNSSDMKQAIVLSEIIQPPLALRDRD